MAVFDGALVAVGVTLVGLVGRIAWGAGSAITELRSMNGGMTRMSGRLEKHIEQNRVEHHQLFDDTGDAKEDIARIKGHLHLNGGG